MGVMFPQTGPPSFAAIDNKSALIVNRHTAGPPAQITAVG